MKITYHKVKLQSSIGITIQKCPLCSETKAFDILCIGGLEGTRYVWFRKFINIYRYTQDKYTCHTCGAKWKSKIKKEKVKIEEF